MKNLKLALFASVTVVAGSANAATQGSMGTTSAGGSLVTIVKENAVQITGVDDITLPTAGVLSATATASDTVCVFSSTGSYTVTVTSTSTSFNLTDDGATDIPYAVTWDDGVAAAESLTYNTASATNFTGDQASADCSLGTNATLTVDVAEAGFNAANPGTYTDTVTLTISPV